MERNEILIIHGTDYKNMAKQILENAGVAEMIGSKDAKIALKPNLVTNNPPSDGATTHAELLAGAVEYLQEKGFKNISIIEGSWVGCRTAYAFQVAGYKDVCETYHVPFVDLQQDSWQEYDAKGMKIKVCDEVMNTDFLINMPVLKGHCQTVITCALKNNKGMMPNSEKRRFHSMGLHRPIAHLATVAPADFILVDNICGDLDFEEGGNPVVMNRVLGMLDPVLCDAFVCESMGVDLDEVPYIGMAEELGVGSTDVASAKITYLNQPKALKKQPRMSRRVQKLAGYAEPVDACSACYGSLIHALNRLDEQGALRGKKEKIAIGQGYRGKTGRLGVGQCTKGFDCSLAGCPPRAADILKFLEDNWE